MKRNQKQITIRTAFTEFLSEKKSLGLSPSTLDNYLTSLQVFLSDNGFDDLLSVSSIDKSCIVKWTTEMLDHQAHNRQSVNHYLRDMRAFLYWCMEQDYLSPFRVRLVAVGEGQIKRYSMEDIQKLLPTPKSVDSFGTWKGWMIAQLCLSTGARLSSLLNLQWNNIDMDSNTISFTHTKNKHILVLPMSVTLKSSLLKYRKTWDFSESSYVLCSNIGDISSTHSLQQCFDKFCSLRNIDGKGIHALRHSFSYLMYENGVDITTIQYYLGHTTLELTRHYIGKLTANDIKKVATPLDSLMISKSAKIKHNQVKKLALTRLFLSGLFYFTCFFEVSVCVHQCLSIRLKYPSHQQVLVAQALLHRKASRNCLYKGHLFCRSSTQPSC